MKSGHSILRAAWTVMLHAGVIAVLMARLEAQSRPEPPDVMTFEGNLVGADGSMIGASSTVNHPMVLRIFDRLVGGGLLWSEQQTVPVVRGRFLVVLGEGSAMGNEPRPGLSTLFRTSTASDRYLEVTVRGAGAAGADATVTPRIRMASGAYALMATHARSALRLVAEGGQAVVTPSGGRVGINQPSPGADLDVNGSVSASTALSKSGISAAGSVRATGFQGRGMAPVGTIVMWTGATPPSGWVLCNGDWHNGTQTPDLRGRFVLAAGRGEGLTPRSRGDVGGAEQHALTAAEMPSHLHSASLWIGSGESSHSHSYRAAVSGLPIFEGGVDRSKTNTRIHPNSTSAAGGHEHSVDIPNFESASAGQGVPHTTMPPFYVLAFIMRVQ